MIIDDVNSTIRCGVDFVCARVRSDGLWAEFDTPAGPSIDWVSAFVLASLGAADEAPSVVDTGVQTLLARARTTGAWGFHEGIPEDCDSTAWAMLALMFGSLVPPLAKRKATDFIVRHQSASGGFATYGSRLALDRLTTLAGSPPVCADWGRPQVCVTSVATLALLSQSGRATGPVLHRAFEYLRQHRQPNGLWHSYWWKGPTYASYYATLALSQGRRLTREDRKVISDSMAAEMTASGGWCDEPGGPTHAFATAHAVLTMLTGASGAAGQSIERGVRWLLDHQAPDGSWASAPMLRVTESSHGRMILADAGRAFTTAGAVHSLAQYRRWYVARKSGG